MSNGRSALAIGRLDRFRRRCVEKLATRLPSAARLLGPIRWYRAGPFVEQVKGRHRGETCYIVGKGPSIVDLTRESFGPGPVICLNESIVIIQELGLENKLYSMQKDGCRSYHQRDVGCRGCDGKVIPMVRPRDSVTLLLHEHESKNCLPDHPDRLVFDAVDELGFGWWSTSSPCAIRIARIFGCAKVVLLAHDSHFGDFRTAMIADDAGQAGVANYGPIAGLVKQELVGIPFEIVPPVAKDQGQRVATPDMGVDPRATVVIPNWNGLSHLEECFAALDAQTLREFEVVFVDNASTDESVEWVKSHQPSVRVITRPDNGGFARAVNAGIEAATTEYVALLNNDTLADPEWLHRLVDALDANACFDFAASLMVLYNEPGKVNAAGDTFSMLTLSGVNRGLGKHTSEYLQPCRVLGACAGASFYRRSMFDDVGLFDEDFFLLHEDTDINLRALVAGKRCLYVPGAVVRHKHHGSIGQQPQRRIQVLEWRNKTTAIAKSMPAPMLVLAAVLLPLVWLRWTFPWRPENWHLAADRMRMVGDIWRSVKAGTADGLAKRARVMETKKVPDRTTMRWILKGTAPYEECKSS